MASSPLQPNRSRRRPRLQAVLAAAVGAGALLTTLAPVGASAATSVTAAEPAGSPFAQVAAAARADTDGVAAPAPAAGPRVISAASVAVPPTPSGLPSAIESWPVPYEAQTSCDPSAKSGVTAWMNLLTTTYGQRSDGISRPCYIGSTSEHEEGRGLDWGIDARNSTTYAQGMAVVNWLLAKDSAGNSAAMARRLGIMYVIFNSEILGFWDSTPTWEPYSCSGVTACHIDHMHFSFSWDGALGRTSYWSKHAVAGTDYGPCRVSGLAWAPQRTANTYSPCQRVSGPPSSSGKPSWYANAAQWSGVTLWPGSANAAVSALQPALGVSVTGAMDSRTVAAVQAVQRVQGLSASGVVGTNTWRAVLGSLPRATRKSVRGDYTGDGKADVAVFRADGRWSITGRSTVTYGGQSGDVPASGDFDGDSSSDIAIFRGGSWYFRNHASVHFGLPGDIPVPADYNGDGKTDIAVFRPSNGTWWIYGQHGIRWGINGDIPVPADYTGDGKAEIAVYRPANGYWYLRGLPSIQYGGHEGDVPMPADFDGNGKADIALFRIPDREWVFRGHASVHFGLSTDRPVPGDFAGDGKADIAVYRPSNGTWWLADGSYAQLGGRVGDIPLEVANPTMA